MFTNFAHAGHDHSEEVAESSEATAKQATTTATTQHESGGNNAPGIVGLEFVIVTFIVAVFLVILAALAIVKAPKNKPRDSDQ